MVRSSLRFTLILASIIFAASVSISSAQVITEIIDSTGDGAGNALNDPIGIAVDGSGNVYITGDSSDNAFKITPGGVITEIIDSTGDGAGKTLGAPQGIAVDAAGNVYVTGWFSDNAFKITPGGTITQIIDATGDGAGNTLRTCVKRHDCADIHGYGKDSVPLRPDGRAVETDRAVDTVAQTGRAPAQRRSA